MWDNISNTSRGASVMGVMAGRVRQLGINLSASYLIMHFLRCSFLFEKGSVC
ncbi:hypothetical protein OROHE_005869 [Orobanche hederae]